MEPKKDPVLKFNPKTVFQHQARYPDALKYLHNTGRIKIGTEKGPWTKREHIFDLKQGIRLIISRDWAPLNPPEERGPFEHLTASIMSAKRAKKYLGKDVLVQVVSKAYHTISRTKPEEKVPFFADFDENGALHILFESKFEEGEYEAFMNEMTGGNLSEETGDS